MIAVGLNIPPFDNIKVKTPVYLSTKLSFLKYPPKWPRLCRLDSMPLIYTVNHKKRDTLFLTITLANINRFLQFLYHFNREEILHAIVVKFTTSP